MDVLGNIFFYVATLPALLHTYINASGAMRVIDDMSESIYVGGAFIRGEIMTREFRRAGREVS